MRYDVFGELYKKLAITHTIMQDKEIPIKNKRDVARKTLKYIKRTYQAFKWCDYDFEDIRRRFDAIAERILK